MAVALGNAVGQMAEDQWLNPKHRPTAEFLELRLRRPFERGRLRATGVGARQRVHSWHDRRHPHRRGGDGLRANQGTFVRTLDLTTTRVRRGLPLVAELVAARRANVLIRSQYSRCKLPLARDQITYRTLARTTAKASISDLATVIAAIAGGTITMLFGGASGEMFAPLRDWLGRRLGGLRRCSPADRRQRTPRQSTE
jgi:hypothetical protein